MKLVFFVKGGGVVCKICLLCLLDFYVTVHVKLIEQSLIKHTGSNCIKIKIKQMNTKHI